MDLKPFIKNLITQVICIYRHSFGNLAKLSSSPFNDDNFTKSTFYISLETLNF